MSLSLFQQGQKPPRILDNTQLKDFDLQAIYCANPASTRLSPQGTSNPSSGVGVAGGEDGAWEGGTGSGQKGLPEQPQYKDRRKWGKATQFYFIQLTLGDLCLRPDLVVELQN